MFAAPFRLCIIFAGRAPEKVEKKKKLKRNRLPELDNAVVTQKL